jgi:hypothetical protein
MINSHKRCSVNGGLVHSSVVHTPQCVACAKTEKEKEKEKNKLGKEHELLDDTLTSDFEFVEVVIVLLTLCVEADDCLHTHARLVTKEKPLAERTACTAMRVAHLLKRKCDHHTNDRPWVAFTQSHSAHVASLHYGACNFDIKQNSLKRFVPLLVWMLRKRCSTSASRSRFVTAQRK